MAAIQVFEAHGYIAGTTARIAERCGISIGSLYQYFPNKDAIMVAVALRHLAEGEALIAEQLRASSSTMPLEDLIHMWVAAMITLHERHPRLHQMLFAQVALPPTVWARVEVIEQQAVQGLAVLLAAHQDVVVADAALAAHLIVELVEAATHRLVLRPPAQYPRERCMNELVQMIMTYLRGG
jgi:AcrR family transcriptional regulator